MSQHRKIAVIGSGPAGYSAAIYAARAGLVPLVITGLDFGGQITKTLHLENYPGFASKIDGIFLTEEMRKQAESFGTKIIADSVASADLTRRPFGLKLENGEEIEAESIIIATGTRERKLGLANEDSLVGHGVSYCAACDGFFFKDKPVVVIGGGNGAVIEALHLSSTASHVTLVHRRGELRAEKLNQDYLMKSKLISVEFNATVEEILESGGAVSGVRIKDTTTGAAKEIKAAGVFVAIGSDPETAIFDVEKDRLGYIITRPDSMATSVEGAFAAGDVRALRHRQAVIAAASGAQAALEALDFLSHK
jgi:thioredoxin reductase (NADPH)